MQVWVYPEKKYEEFGAERWECEWQEVKPTALARVKAAEARGEFDEIDIDLDLLWYATHHKTEKAARSAARRHLKERQDYLAFGSITITKQVVDWYVEEDRVAEWANVGESIYVD